MSAPQSPTGRPAGRLPDDLSGDPVVIPPEVNENSLDLGENSHALERNVHPEDGNQNKAQQVRAQATAKAAQLRSQARDKAPQVRAQAAEKAQQIRVRAAEKAPQVAQAHQGKAVGALALVLLVSWLRRRWNRRSSGSADGVASALNQQARSLVDDTVDALSADDASTGRTRDKARKARGRAAARAQAVEKAQQARAQAVEKAQQARTQAVEKAQQLREQAAEKAQAAENAQQAAQEAEQLVKSLRKRRPRR